MTKFHTTFLLKERTFKQSINLCVFILIAFVCAPIPSFADSNSAKKTQLKKEISRANSSLKKSRQASTKLEQKVRAAEDKLNTISKELHSTEKKISRLTSKLTNSNKERGRLLKQTNKQKDALAQQLQALYTSGKQSHLRLIFKQDDPSEIGRKVKYFEIMNQHRLKRLDVIKAQNEKLELLQTKINADSKTLKALQRKQYGRKSSLKKAVKEKENAYKNQKKVVYSQELKLAKLRKRESRLQGVIQRLAKQRKVEETERKQAKEEQKRAQANKKKASKKQKTVAQTHYVPNKPFSTLRGRLSWPVKGKLTQKFGSSRNSKQRWKGVIISAKAGTRVHAVARGKVEFSGRLRGYGYLVIIRHDKNYRSLYAYNRSVYKKEGEIVKKGEAIAAVGSSGSQSNSGLYFEIRKGTQPENPNKWIR